MTQQQSIAVLGGGSFGTAIANLLAENGHHVLLWMRDAQQAECIRTQRQNPRYLKGVEVLPQVEPTTDLASTLKACELVFVALPSSALRQALQPFAAQLGGKMLISTTKGIEADGFTLMSQILEQIAPQARIGVLS
ncbi:MAG: 2-dehydropantoate 2-reductase N-terminal domain-containing protein, partial [Gammaproteobacteria bacterium]